MRHLLVKVPDKRHKTSPFEWSWSNPLFGYKIVMVKLDNPDQDPIHQVRLVKTEHFGRKNSENLRDFYIMKWIENHPKAQKNPYRSRFTVI